MGSSSAQVVEGGQTAESVQVVTSSDSSFTRDEEGRATVRAIHLLDPLRVDGQLDENVYRANPPITGFFQTLPKENAESSEHTEAWVMFDTQYIYVAARLFDSAPPDQWTANEMRRDTSQLRQNDHFGVAFDTFHDHRNGFFSTRIRSAPGPTPI
jgi:hypothetical protein